MKKSKINFLIILIIIVIIMGISGYILRSKNDSTSVNSDDVINLSECSEDFMNNYFDEMREIQEIDNKDNILIVTSKNKIKDGYGASKIVEAPNNQYYLQYNTENERYNAIQEFEKDETIISVEENLYYTINESDYNSWGIEKMSLDTAITVTNEKELNNVTVAIIDTGCDIELFNKYYNGKLSETYDVLKESTQTMNDENGHGTHVAGTIAEGTPQNVKVFPIKVSTNGSLYFSDVITGINYITYYEKADVINMSFGGYGYSEALYNAIESAKEKNILSVAAAGNDNTSRKHYPSSYDNTISIASVNSSLNKSSFSNYGSDITFVAPGSNIKSIMSKKASLSENSDGDDDHEIISGTSMATPHAVSAVAILKSYNKNLNLDNTIDLLKIYATDLGDTGWDMYYGYGMISFKNAEFADGEDNDEYGVFKKKKENPISRIEINTPTLTEYNYGSIYNLLDTPINLYFNNDEYITKKLWEIDELEITGYDAYSSDEQIITVKFNNLTTSFTITNPQEFQSGWEYNVLDENSIELTLYKDNSSNIGKLYIPETINEYKVVSLANNSNLISKVFANSTDRFLFKEIILPKYFTNLGRASLMGLSSLQKITVLADNISVGEYALYGLTKITQFDGLIIELGEGAFRGCRLINNIRLSDSISSIPKLAFCGCDNLENINIPTNVTSIEDHAFEGDYKLTEIDFPEGLKTIGKSAFYSTNLEVVILPNSTETIKQEAFCNAHIIYLSIPKNLTSIGNNAFSECASLEVILVDEENTIYDSRDESNAIIQTATNTLIRGTANTTIPKTVTAIGDKAFDYDLRIDEIEIPESVTQIGSYAFYGCDYLEKITIGRNIETIGENAFKYYSAKYNVDGEKLIPTFWTYNDAYAKTYAIENNLNYETKDPSYVLVSTSKTEYNAFDSVNNDDIISVKLYYDKGYLSGTTYNELKKVAGREEIVEDGYNISYINNRDSFRYGDEYYTISGDNEHGESYSKQVNVVISKLIPEYINLIPDNLTAVVGQRLSDIQLPDGFEWMDSALTINQEGSVKYKARYIPEDTNNYQTIENIDIEILVTVPNPEKPLALTIEGTYTYNGENQKVNVLEFDSNTMEISGDIQFNAGTYTITVTSKTGRWNDNTTTPVYGEWTINKQEITPEIEIEDKVFDNTTDIDKNTITISNLDNTEYSIESAVLNSINVGNTTANVTIKLTDDKYQNYTLSNNNQEFSYTVNVCIIAAKELDNILITKCPNKTTYLVGENFDSTGMEVTAHYTDNSTRVIDNYEIINSNNLSYGVDEVIIRYSEDGITKETVQNINVLDNTIIRYKTHVQNDGWQNWKTQGQMSGTQGRSLRLEGICINLENNVLSGSVKYSTHIQNIGWQEEKVNGQMSGTEGQSLRLEAIKIKLEGNISQYYDIYYRVHAQNFGWLGWAKNGEAAGTAGYAYRLEGIEIVLSRKETQFEGNTINCFKQNIQYRTHVQDVGWQDNVNSGEMSGTSGRSLRLEGIIISLNNTDVNGNLEYRTHVQNIGWQGWVNNNQMSGTSGQGLRLEAIQIKLTGRLAEKYDIYYRVHCQNFGWLGWAKNGESSGTEGYAYRLEGIEIKLVDKNENVPLNGEAFYINR